MPSEDVHREIDRRMRHLAATLGRPPAAVRDLLDTTFAGVSSAGTVTVKLDFRGALRDVHIKADTVIPGDEQALCKAIMEAHANATATMTTAWTAVPPTTAKPEAGPGDPHGRRRGAAADDLEEAGPILRRR
jgi:DNA-binding protein YbaB